MDKIYNTGVSATYHFAKVGKVKTGLNYETQSVWFEISSGLVDVTMFFRNEDKELNQSIDMAVNVLDEIKAQLEKMRLK